MNTVLEEYVDLGDTFIIMNRLSIPDGYGGQITAWSEGAPFKASLEESTTIETRIGQKLGVTSIYTVTTRKNVNLQPLMVFRRQKDGKTFRVTSEAKSTIDSSKVNMAFFIAEDYTLTGEIDVEKS